MEKYSKHLETIVAERTQDLLIEKHKTEILLYSKYHSACYFHLLLLGNIVCGVMSLFIILI